MSPFGQPAAQLHECLVTLGRTMDLIRSPRESVNVVIAQHGRFSAYPVLQAAIIAAFVLRLAASFTKSKAPECLKLWVIGAQDKRERDSFPIKYDTEQGSYARPSGNGILAKDSESFGVQIKVDARVPVRTSGKSVKLSLEVGRFNWLFEAGKNPIRAN